MAIDKSRKLNKGFWITELKIPESTVEFSLDWRSDGPPQGGKCEMILDYFGEANSSKNQDSPNIPVCKEIRPIPSLSAPKLAVVTRQLNRALQVEDILELFATAKGGDLKFKAGDDATIEGSNQYQVKWQRSCATDFKMLHVVKYFADGQTLCASWKMNS
jgi:hypothetical protein